MKRLKNSFIFLLFFILNVSSAQNTGSLDKYINSYCNCIEKMNDSRNLKDNYENDCLDEFIIQIKDFKKENISEKLKKRCPNSAAAFYLEQSNIFNIDFKDFLVNNRETVEYKKDYLKNNYYNEKEDEYLYGYLKKSLSVKEKDSIAIIYFSKGKEYFEKGKKKKALKILLKAFDYSSPANFVKMDIIDYLLELKEYDLAETLLSRIAISYANHLYLARHYFHLGLINVKKEWATIKKAQFLFIEAHKQMMKAKAKDLQLWSDILNAIGYTSITGRGLSKYANESDGFCIQHSDYFKIAYPYFVWALKYNPENEAAKQNRDTLLQKFDELDTEVPYVDIHQIPDLDTLTLISLDSIDMLKINETDSIIYDAGLLPENYQQILKVLNKYDEIILVLDFSGSMKDPTSWSGGVSKFTTMHHLAKYLVKKINKKSMVGVISVGNSCNPADGIFMMSGVAQKSRAELMFELENILPYGATPLNQRLTLTPKLFSNRKNNKTVFLISDGMDVCDEAFDVCFTASFLHDQGIDFSLFSYILESDDDMSRYAYEIYECMVQQSKGKIFSVDKEGKVEERQINKLKDELKLVLPYMVKSNAWKGHKGLYQFEVKSVFGN